MQFRRKNFLQQTQAILEQHGVSSDYIELEITEGTVMDNVDKAIITMQALYDAGLSQILSTMATVKQ